MLSTPQSTRKAYALFGCPFIQPRKSPWQKAAGFSQKSKTQSSPLPTHKEETRPSAKDKCDFPGSGTRGANAESAGATSGTDGGPDAPQKHPRPAELTAAPPVAFERRWT